MKSFDDAVQQRDRVLDEGVLGEDYALVLVHPAPAEVPRARWLQVLEDYVVHSYVVEEQRVDGSGDMAAVLSKVHMHATVLGEDRSGVLVIGDFWRRGKDGWKVWRRHSSPMSAGEMPGAQLPFAMSHCGASFCQRTRHECAGHVLALRAVSYGEGCPAG